MSYEVVANLPQPAVGRGPGRGLNPETQAVIDAAHTNPTMWIRIPCVGDARAGVRSKFDHHREKGRLSRVVMRQDGIYVRWDGAS
jgi:hypothetical protein